MDIHTATTIVATLAQGINPASGEKLPSDSPYNHPDVIRAFYALLGRLPKRKKTPAEKRAENIKNGLPPNTALPWSDSARVETAAAFRSGIALEEIASAQERSKTAIIAELHRQGIISTADAAKLGLRLSFAGERLQ